MRRCFLSGWWNSAHVLSVISNGIETQAEINETLKADGETKRRERERGHRFFRGNIESKINHPGSRRWRTAVSRGLRRIEAAVEKKWALSINYCPIYSFEPIPLAFSSIAILWLAIDFFSEQCARCTLYLSEESAMKIITPRLWIYCLLIQLSVRVSFNFIIKRPSRLSSRQRRWFAIY